MFFFLLVLGIRVSYNWTYINTILIAFKFFFNRKWKGKYNILVIRWGGVTDMQNTKDRKKIDELNCWKTNRICSPKYLAGERLSLKSSMYLCAWMSQNMNNMQLTYSNDFMNHKTMNSCVRISHKLWIFSRINGFVITWSQSIKM